MTSTNRPQPHRLSSLTGNADADYILDLGTDGAGDGDVDTVDSLTGSTTPTQSSSIETTSTSTRIRRSASYLRKLHTEPGPGSELKKLKERMDKSDCGICFEPALHPRKAPCCQALFCKEHITDWLTGPNASTPGLCPSCDTPCTVDPKQGYNIIPIPSPNTPAHPHTHIRHPHPHIAPPETIVGIGEVPRPEEEEDGDDGGEEGDDGAEAQAHGHRHRHGHPHESTVDVGGIKDPGT